MSTFPSLPKMQTREEREREVNQFRSSVSSIIGDLCIKCNTGRLDWWDWRLKKGVMVEDFTRAYWKGRNPILLSVARAFGIPKPGAFPSSDFSDERLFEGGDLRLLMARLLKRLDAEIKPDHAVETESAYRHLDDICEVGKYAVLDGVARAFGIVPRTWELMDVEIELPGMMDSPFQEYPITADNPRRYVDLGLCPL